MFGRTFIFGLVLVVVTPCPSNAYIRISLQKEENTKANKILNDLNNKWFVYNKKDIHPSGDLFFQNFQYYGKIKVGRPGQPFKVSFSTLTTSVFIPSNMATVSCGPKNHQTFIESNSKTFFALGGEYPSNPPFTRIKDGLDEVEMDGVLAKNQSITLILDGNCEGFAFDGIVGLGFRQPNQKPTLLDNFYNNKMIPQNTVGLKLNRDYTCKKECGEIVFGGWNNKNVDSQSVRYISAAPSPETLWKITLNRVFFGSTKLNENIYAILDISSTFILMPETALNHIASAAPQLIKYNNTLYYIDKSQVKNLPSLTFNIDGKDYTLTGSDYVDTAYTGGDKLSLVLLTSTKGLSVPPNTWILGDAFIGKYYTIFDYNSRKVAFANLNGASSLVPLSFMVTLAFISSLLRFWL